MTMYDAWVTGPDPIDIAGSFRSVFFPEGRDAFFVIKKGIETGRFRGEQSDHLVWRAQMTRGEILTLLEELFGPAGAYETKHAGVMEHMADRMRALRAFGAGLADGHAFSVTVDEF